MALTTHRLLGFSRPVVKDGAVFVPVRLGDGLVALSGSTGVMTDLGRALLESAGEGAPPSALRPPSSDPAPRRKPGPKPGGRPRTPISAELEATFRTIRQRWYDGLGTQRDLCRAHHVSAVRFIKWLQRVRAQERAERIAGTGPVLKPGGRLL